MEGASWGGGKCDNHYSYQVNGGYSSLLWYPACKLGQRLSDDNLQFTFLHSGNQSHYIRWPDGDREGWTQAASSKLAALLLYIQEKGYSVESHEVNTLVLALGGCKTTMRYLIPCWSGGH